MEITKEDINKFDKEVRELIYQSERNGKNINLCKFILPSKFKTLGLNKLYGLQIKDYSNKLELICE